MVAPRRRLGGGGENATAKAAGRFPRLSARDAGANLRYAWSPIVYGGLTEVVATAVRWLL